LGKITIHTKLFGQLPGRRLVVARNNRQMLDAALTQPVAASAR
jgi:hypothetical protein